MFRKLFNVCIICVCFMVIPCIVAPCVEDSFERAWHDLTDQEYDRQFRVSVFGGVAKKTRATIDGISDELKKLGQDTYGAIQNTSKVISDKIVKAKTELIEKIAEHRDLFNQTIHHLSQSIVNNECIKKGLAQGFALFDQHEIRDAACIDGKVNELIDSLTPLANIAKQAQDDAANALKKSADCTNNDDTLLQLKEEPCLLRVLVETEATKAFIKAKNFVLLAKMKLDFKLFPVKLTTCNLAKKAFETGIEITKIIGDVLSNILDDSFCNGELCWCKVHDRNNLGPVWANIPMCDAVISNTTLSLPHVEKNKTAKNNYVVVDPFIKEAKKDIQEAKAALISSTKNATELFVKVELGVIFQYRAINYSLETILNSVPEYNHGEKCFSDKVLQELHVAFHNYFVQAGNCVKSNYLKTGYDELLKTINVLRNLTEHRIELLEEDCEYKYEYLHGTGWEYLACLRSILKDELGTYAITAIEINLLKVELKDFVNKSPEPAVACVSLLSAEAKAKFQSILYGNSNSCKKKSH